MIRFFFAVVLLSVLPGLNGCKEGCTDVECAPAPPLLSLQVLDSASVATFVPVLDSVTGDTLGFRDTVVVRTIPVSEAMVTLHTVASGIVGSPFDTIPASVADTLYIYDNRSRLPAAGFAVVATRGDRADTLQGLTVKHIEGCCGYDVVGYYAGNSGLRLPAE